MEFKRKFNLERHVSTVHNGESRFECDQCEQKYKRKRDLDRHVNETHLKVRPFVCGECGLSFAGAERLRKHRKVKHDGSNAVVDEAAASVTDAVSDDEPSLALLASAGQVLPSDGDGDFQLADELAQLTAATSSTADLLNLNADEDKDNIISNDNEHVHCNDCGHVAVLHDGHVDWIVDGRLETADHEDHGIAPDEKTLNEWLNQLFGSETTQQQERRIILQ